MNKALDSLHTRILNSKFSEEVTETEIEALIQAKNNDWIPCSERLPDKDLYVLCQGNHSIFIACIDSLDNKWRDDHYYTRTTIKAWQPLPQPYKEGSADNA